MKILVYGDLQATEGHERTYEDPTLSLQRWRVRKFYEDAGILAKSTGCEAVWDLGDTLDDRNALPIAAVDAVLEGLDQLPDSKYNVKLIGNHDQLLRSGEIHNGRVFKQKFKVVDEVAEFALGGFGTPVLLACAFSTSSNVITDWLVDRVKFHKAAQRKVVLLGHFQVLGCQLNSGLSLEGVAKTALHGVDLGLLGHVHKFQELLPNVFYVGSPFQQDFGEAGEEKVVAVVDTNTLAVEWYTLDGFPRYRVADYKTFEAEVREDSEDRWQVVIKTYAEAEKFYAHPLAVRAEPVYDYSSGEAAPGRQAASGAVPSWLRDFDLSLRRYAQQVPPASRGVQLDVEELIGYGKEISAGLTDANGD